MKVQRIILFLLLVFIANSCYREPIHPIENQYYYVDDECRAYFGSAKTGSVFIYEQEGTGLIDTTKTRLSASHNFRDTAIDRYIRTYQEVLDVHYTPQFAETYTTRISFYKPEEFWFEVITPVSGNFDVHKKDGKWIRPYDTTMKVKILDSLVVKGRVFKDVLYMDDNRGNIFEAWFAKGVGIIKKRDAANRTFVLKDWII